MEMQTVNKDIPVMEDDITDFDNLKLTLKSANKNDAEFGISGTSPYKGGADVLDED